MLRMDPKYSTNIITELSEATILIMDSFFASLRLTNRFLNTSWFLHPKDIYLFILSMRSTSSSAALSFSTISST